MAVSCVFCAIVRGELPARTVFEDEVVVAFLDARPLFAGHTLVVPRSHQETLDDLAPQLIEPLFAAAQRVSRAIQSALGAHGSLLGVNTRVSQSVPHVHVHVVPRHSGDGLFSQQLLARRRPYRSDAEADEVAAKLREALARVRPGHA